MCGLKTIVLALCALTQPALAGGLQASYTGVPDPCDNRFTRPSTVLEFCGKRDGAGNLLDVKGSNLVIYSEQVNNVTGWAASRSTVSANVIRNPVNGELDAELITEDDTAAQSHTVSQASRPLVADELYTMSVYVKAADRSWVAPYVATDAVGAYFDVRNGAEGNVLGSHVIASGMIPVKPGWWRIWVSWKAPATASRTFQFYLADSNGGATYDGLNLDGVYVWGFQLEHRRNRADALRGPGPYKKTEANDKPAIDLAPTNAPTNVCDGPQAANGNPTCGQRFVRTSTQYFVAADDDSVDVFAGDFTLTAEARVSPDTDSTGYVFAKGVFSNQGGYLYYSTGTNQFYCRLNSGASTCDALTSAVDDIDANRWHVVQCIRRSDIVVACVDGSCGEPVNCDGFGTGGGASITVGASSGGTVPADGSINYVRLDEEALSPDELAEELAVRQSVATSITQLGARNAISDGTMEAVDTSAWNNGGGNGVSTLSKVTTNPHGGLRALRVANENGSVKNVFARQSICTAGKTYRFTGFARTKGTGGFSARLYSDTQTQTYLWQGTLNATEWEPVDVVATAGVTGYCFYMGGTSMADGEYTEWDDVYVYEFNSKLDGFSRSTAGTVATGEGLLSVAPNVPRVGGKGGGLLIEGQAKTVIGRTEAFDAWNDAGAGATVTADDHIAPDGSLTADKLDNTAGANTDGKTIYTADLGDLTGEHWTFCVWARADTPHNVTLRIYENPAVGGSETAVSLTTEWQRFSFTRTGVGGGNNTFSTQVYPGERAVATGVAHFWGANLVEGKYCPSYIPNAGAFTTQATRTGDSYTIDPHPERGEQILPLEYDEDGVLTLEFDAKCHWSGSTNLGATSRKLIDIGGNTGTADWDRNRVMMHVSSGGLLYGYFKDDDGSGNNWVGSVIDPVDFSDWHTFKFKIDFEDLSNVEMMIDGVDAIDSTNEFTGAGTFDTSGVLIRLGQTNIGTPDADCWFDKVRINSKEF